MAVHARVPHPAAAVRIVRRDQIDGARRTAHRLLSGVLSAVALGALLVTTALFFAGLYGSAAIGAVLVVAAGWGADRVKYVGGRAVHEPGAGDDGG